MSIRGDKKNIITTIGAYTSLNGEIPDRNDTLLSLNESKNPTNFLIDVLNVTIGREGFKTLIGEMFVNLVDEINPSLNDNLKTQLIQYNEGDDLPDYFINDGIDIPIKNIDFYSKLKNDPQSDIGELLYGETSDTFDKKAYEAIVNEDTDITYENLIIKYNPDSDTFNFKPTNGDVTIGEFVSDFIDNTTILNKDVFVGGVVNSIFGNITTNEDKSIEKIFEEKKINHRLEHIVNGVSEDRDVKYEITENELNVLYEDSSKLKRGVIEYNMGCDVLITNVDFNELKDLVNELTSLTDPNEISENLENVLINNSNVINNLDSNIIKENQNTIIDGFFKNIINKFKFELTKETTLSPQVLTLFLLLFIIENDGIYEEKTPNDIIDENQNLILCLTKNVSSRVNEFIYNIIIILLNKLLFPIIKQIIREKINQYIGILRSLIRR